MRICLVMKLQNNQNSNERCSSCLINLIENKAEASLCSNVLIH